MKYILVFLMLINGSFSLALGQDQSVGKMIVGSRADSRHFELSEELHWLQKASLEIQTIGRRVEAGETPFANCSANPGLPKLRENLKALAARLAIRQKKLDKLTTARLDQELSYDVKESEAKIDSCQGSFMELKVVLADRKRRIVRLGRQLDEAVASGDQQAAAEGHKLALTLQRECPSQRNDAFAWLMSNAIETSLRSYVQRYSSIKKYFESQLSAISTFEERIANKRAHCRGL